VIALILVFHSYLTYPNTIFSFTQDTGATSLWPALQDLLMFVVTFFIIVGSMFYWLGDIGHTWILVLVGVIVSFGIVVAILKASKSVDANAYSFQFYGLLLFLAMILIISFGRYYSFGSSRYSVYAAFLWSPSSSALHASRRMKLLVCSATISLVYFFSALHYHRPYLLELEQKDETCRNLWRTEASVCGVMISHQEATQIVQSAIDQGIYRIEQ